MPHFMMKRATLRASSKGFCLAAGVLLLTGCGGAQSGAAQGGGQAGPAQAGAVKANAAPSAAAKAGAAKAEVIHVFLLGGQSNAAGATIAQGLPDSLKAPQKDVSFYSNLSEGLESLQPVGTAAEVNNRRFGPEITFGRTMADYYAPSGDRVAILKHAEDGTTLYKDWKADGTKDSQNDGPVYARFQSTIVAGMAALRAAHPGSAISIDGMIWMQGESDANPTNSAAYQANLTAFLDDIRMTYGPDLKFVTARLSSRQTFGGHITAADLNNVRTAQTNVSRASPRNGLVSTDDLPLQGDEIHFTADGQIALGTSFAKAMQTLVGPGKPTTATQ